MEGNIDEPDTKKPKLDMELDNEENADKDDSDKTSQTASDDGKPMSKRQQKKLAKRENFHQWKMEKRQKEKEKKKQKKREQLERGEPRTKPSKYAMKRNKMADSKCKVKVVVDSSFDDYMTEREINSHVLQMQHSYAANRRSTNPLQFYVTSVSGPTEKRLENVGDYKGWDVNFHTKHYLDLFKKEDVVYLSSDSPNVMETVTEDKVYIIGGLVDHNKHKGLCHRKAEELGVAHARLPIEEYIKLQTRKVLACNHVFEVLLRYTEVRDWEKAFFSSIPKRKGAEEKGNGSTKDDEQDHNNEGDANSEGREDSQDSTDMDTELNGSKNSTKETNTKDSDADNTKSKAFEAKLDSILKDATK